MNNIQLYNSSIQPLKGLREPRTVVVSYRALSPYGEPQPVPTKALSNRITVPTTPPPFRHTPYRFWPQEATPVWRNLLQHPRGDDSFTFSAKERDSETGLSYFGSRYYSSDLSIWLSVDPMSDKYASLSPYVYCANNPVRCVDPNGEEIDDNLDKWKYNKTTKQLSWYSNTGGKCHQIVVETENTSSGEKVSRTIEFDGAIGRMFDFSIFNPKIDNIINGIIEMKNGAKTFTSGMAFGFATEGGGTAISAALCFWGAYEIGDGFITVMKAFAGKEFDPYGQQDIVKDILNTTVNTGAGLIKENAKTGAQIFKHTTKNIAKSFLWSVLQYYFVSHPTCLGAPEGSTIKKMK